MIELGGNHRNITDEVSERIKALPLFRIPHMSGESTFGIKSELQRQGLCPRGITSFTFVREPLGHFLSGFAETYWRSTQDYGWRQRQRRQRQRALSKTAEAGDRFRGTPATAQSALPARARRRRVPRQKVNCIRGVEAFDAGTEPSQIVTPQSCRGMLDGWSATPRFNATAASAVTARVFVMMLLEAQDPVAVIEPLFTMWRHTALQTGVIMVGGPLDIIGRLETIAVDWSRLVTRSGISALQRHFGGGAAAAGDPQLPHGVALLPHTRHVTSGDPQGAKRAMEGAFRQQPLLLSGICSLLAADYACFGYSFEKCAVALSNSDRRR